MCDEERHVWPAISSLCFLYMFVCPFLNEGTHSTFFSHKPSGDIWSIISNSTVLNTQRVFLLRPSHCLDTGNNERTQDLLGPRLDDDHTSGFVFTIVVTLPSPPSLQLAIRGYKQWYGCKLDNVCSKIKLHRTHISCSLGTTTWSSFDVWQRLSQQHLQIMSQ